jgi:hypothetical protein
LTFAAAFIGLVILEWLLGWVLGLPKIDLTSAGKVDGVWLHARYEASTGRKIGGSVVHVETSRPNRFHVYGKSYLQDKTFEGWFDGKGWKDREDGFVYAYTGGQARGTITGSGTGQYVYMNRTGGHAIMVEGSFRAHGLPPLQIVRGKWHGSRIDENVEATILMEYLKQEAPAGVKPEK